MTDIQTQYNAVRTDIGLIDRSDVGKIAIYGADRFSWLQGMVSNDVRLLQSGAPALQACILDATGHILSNMLLINAADDKPFVLIVLPAANAARIAALFDKYIIMEDVEVKDVSSEWVCACYQGPRAVNIFANRKKLFQEEITDVRRGGCIEVEADHSGSGGWDWFMPQDEGVRILRKWIEKNSAPLIGLEAQEILRVEAGIPKYGLDMDEATLAPEAGLMATHISLTKGCYVGQEIVARIDSRGHTNRALTGLVFDMGDVPTSGDKIFADDDETGKRESGRVTSVVGASPAMNGRPIALGYVRHEHRAPGSRLRVQGQNIARTAQVVELPFYHRPEREAQAVRHGQADMPIDALVDAATDALS